MGHLDDLPTGLRADVHPAALYSPNRIRIMILSQYIWDAYYLFWTVNGGPESTQRILERPDTEAGTVYHDFFSIAGSHYTFQVQGCPVPLTGPVQPGDSHCSP